METKLTPEQEEALRVIINNLELEDIESFFEWCKEKRGDE